MSHAEDHITHIHILHQALILLAVKLITRELTRDFRKAHCPVSKQKKLLCRVSLMKDTVNKGTFGINLNRMMNPMENGKSHASCDM